MSSALLALEVYRSLMSNTSGGEPTPVMIKPAEVIENFGQDLELTLFGSPGTAVKIAEQYAKYPSLSKVDAMAAYSLIMALPEEHPWRIAEEPLLKKLIGMG